MKNNQNNNGSGFLPEGYEAPANGSNYLKLEKGEHKIRIMSKPIIGWLDWKDKKPYRYRMDEKPAKSFDPAKPIKHFWAFLVWSYEDSAIKLLEVTQKSIQAAIAELSKNEDWGEPFGYDLRINRTGESLETKYTVTPVPHKKLPDEIIQAFNNRPCNLEALYDNEDPFAEVSSEEKTDLPF